MRPICKDKRLKFAKKKTVTTEKKEEKIRPIRKKLRQELRKKKQSA